MISVRSVTAAEIQHSVRILGLSGRALCVHASLRSFGRVEGGAPTVVNALLAEGCSVLVPTFSSTVYQAWPDPPDLIGQNGLGVAQPIPAPPTAVRIYSPDACEIDPDMGAIPAAVLATPGCVRGAHPINSFTAVGPLAHELIAPQQPWHVHAALEALVAAGGAVVLMGVGLERMTLLHLAEQRAGRAPFIRWARGSDGRIIRVCTGGCSEGFPQLVPALEMVIRRVRVGQSLWQIMPATAALSAAVAAIRADPSITHCGDSACDRCNDAVLGGPSRAQSCFTATSKWRRG